MLGFDIRCFVGRNTRAARDLLSHVVGAGSGAKLDVLYFQKYCMETSR